MITSKIIPFVMSKTGTIVIGKGTYHGILTSLL